MAQEKETRINDAITAPRVRLIGVEGEVLGIMSLSEAFLKAEQAETDIVEIAPVANPPVCRLMDYGKYRYAETKRQHEVKLKQKQKQIKEVKFRLGTDDGDYKIKIRNIVRFITGGDKAKISLRFRGREGTRHEFGIALLKRIEADLTSCAIVEQHPKLEGRQMVMMLAPIKKKS